MAEEWGIVALATLVVGVFVARWSWALARAGHPAAPGAGARARLQALETELLGERPRNGSSAHKGGARNGDDGRADAASVPLTAVVLDGFSPMAAGIWDWAELDDRFFQAANQMIDTSLESLADASAAMADWDFDAMFGSAAELVQLANEGIVEAMGALDAAILEEAANEVVTGAATGMLELTTDQVGASIPIFTMAAALLREVRLLRRGHTSLRRAGANVLADTGSVGLGGTVGAKAGAMLGTVIAPGVGTVVGAALGGSTGALLGRRASRKLKGIPLEKAETRFARAVAEYGVERDRELLELGNRWDATLEEERRWLHRAADAIKRQAEARVAGARDALRAAHTLPGHVREAVLASAERDLVDAARVARNAWRTHGWRRWLWPSPQLVTAGRRARALAKYVERWRLEAETY